jgi:hypothetical protein
LARQLTIAMTAVMFVVCAMSVMMLLRIQRETLERELSPQLVATRRLECGK